MRHVTSAARAAVATTVVVAMLIGATAPVAAQSAELRAVHARMMVLYGTGHTGEAAAVAEQALALGIGEFGAEHPSTAALMMILATLHGELGQWPSAERLYRDAAAVREATLGANHPELGEAYAGLGKALAAQARYAEAETSYWKALAALGEEVARNPHMIDAVSLRAGLYRARAIYFRAHQLVAEDRLGEAELMYQNAIAVFEANAEVVRGEIVVAIEERAAVLRALGRDDQATALEAHGEAVRQGRASCPAGLFTTC